MLPAFTEAYRQRYRSDKTLAGLRRKRSVGGGRRGRLDTVEQKMLFILVYVKIYPLQEVMGELFGMSVGAANQWIHRLLPVLREAMVAIMVMPEREGQKFAQAESLKGEHPDYIIDGTERRRQLLKNPEKQALHYRRKTHTDKNVVIVQALSKRVGYLSPNYSGKTHDKRIADEGQISYPPDTVLRKDTGFQGYEPKVKETHQLKKTAWQRVESEREEAKSGVGEGASESGTRH